MIMFKQGKVDAARQLYGGASKMITLPQSAEQPLSGKKDAQGAPLVVWLTQREARALLEADSGVGQSSGTAAGRK